MALRLAIVASDISPIAETIGEVGWPLIPPDDAQSLADELFSVLQGGAQSEACKDAGEKRFRTMFTSEAAADGMAELYRSVLRKCGA
jgi:glycosyltransferase involved in cell wall biosynthesis